MSQYIDLVKKLKKWYFAEVSRSVGSDLTITVCTLVLYQDRPEHFKLDLIKNTLSAFCGSKVYLKLR